MSESRESNDAKRARPIAVRQILIPSPSPSPELARSTRTRKKLRRANESPLTFIRSHDLGTSGSRLDAKVGQKLSLSDHLGQWMQRALFYSEESLACLNAQSGTQFRHSVYGLLPMMEHEQFDTMGIRQARNFFSSVPAGPVPAMADFVSSNEEEEEPEITGVEPARIGVPLAAVPRLDPDAYAERSYVFRLSEAEEPVALISIEHAIEELLERCSFLRDPATTWVCRPDKLHVLLATTAAPNVTREEKNCKGVIDATPAPVTLVLHRFMWRRQGTLWVQWHCVSGNIDRLRADLRAASGGSSSLTFTNRPEDDLHLSRPFAVETLVMALLQKPTKDEFAQLMSVTNDMQRMFSGVSVKFSSVSRLARIHDRLDRDALDESSLMLDLTVRPTDSVIERLALGVYIARTSPAVKRMVTLTAVGIFGLGLVWLTLRRS